MLPYLSFLSRWPKPILHNMFEMVYNPRLRLLHFMNRGAKLENYKICAGQTEN